VRRVRGPVEVRIAMAGDLPAIVASFGQEWFFRDRLLRQELDQGELFVAFAGSTAVGNVYLWRERPHERAVRERLGWTPTLNHLEVAAQWRRHGIGTSLVRAAEAHASALGYWRLGLGVALDNPDARRLYERLGYADWGHGLVESVWAEPGSGRSSLVCDWMVRALPTEAPPVDAWAPWTPGEVRDLLRQSTVDWYVAGGWALDLWLRRHTRHHAAIEVAVDRTAFPSWRAELARFPLYANGMGRLRRLLPGESDPPVRQVWLRDPVEPLWRMDTFLEERPEGWWACHWLQAARHPMAIAVARTDTGIAYLRPELVLLGKARHRRPKDEADLVAVLPTLDAQARSRLREGLLAAPDAEPHPWLTAVDQ
jgi:GNAT superfamily N-acetyltransferase